MPSRLLKSDLMLVASFLLLVTNPHLCLAQNTVADEQQVQEVETLQQLKQREKRITESLKKVMPATVCVTDGIGFGSGVVVSKDGYVLTAGHVLLTEGRRLRLIFPDGREIQAKRLGKNLGVDAGMVKITEPGPWPHVELGDTDKVRRGDWCIALGHSGGYVLGRQPPVRTGRVLNTNQQRMITDCALIGGDSGGPIFDLDGMLIGINSSIGASIAENRHVAVNVFKTDWDRLAAGETWGKLAELSKVKPGGPLLGIKLDKKIQGKALIERVAEDTPAAEAGIRPGDSITAINGEQISDWQQVIDTIADFQPRDRIRIEVRRGGQLLEIPVQLRRRDVPRSE